MSNILSLPLHWFDRDQRASVGGGMLVLLVHLVVMGSLFQDMARPTALI